MATEVFCGIQEYFGWLCLRKSLSQVGHRNLNSRSSLWNNAIDLYDLFLFLLSMSISTKVQSSGQRIVPCPPQLQSTLKRGGWGWGAGGTNMAGGPALPRGEGNIMSWAGTPKGINYKDLKVQPGKQALKN